MHLMLPRPIAVSPGWLCAVLVLAGATRVLAAEPSTKIDFDRQIRPILSDICFHCHGPDPSTRDSELRLDTKEGAFADLGGHRAIVPGDVAASTLIARILTSDPDERMPPPDSGRQLKPAQIELLQQWIAQGAEWQQHWSFAPIVRPALPAVQHTHWSRNAIDTFVLARLESEQLTPASEADKAALLRRVTLDLTGLPPTLAELDAFLNDPSPDAYDQVVDRLFASPRYGERMVWEWLDAARYADTNGFQGDRTRTMWPWRDATVAALNRNQPFDQFTIEQLAGDLLPEPSHAQRLATGFHRNHMLNGEGGRIAEESRIDYVIDRVDTTSAAWLGLTLGCSRCHDHKYDPFTQKEYFQLFAYFNNVPESGAVDRDGSANPVIEAPTTANTQRLAEFAAQLKTLQLELDDVDLKLKLARAEWETALKGALEKIPGEAAEWVQIPADKIPERVKQLGDEFFAKSPKREQLQAKLAEVTKARDEYKKRVPLVMVMEERPTPRETFVLLRGSYDKFGDKVTPQLPAQLSPPAAGTPANRLGLAQWLVQSDHPLTARVIVNRQWQMFFGIGLVKTTEDFGVQGERPSHPELLDWLAAEFKDRGWNVKALQRTMVLSSTYRQTSRTSASLAERDPDNRLLARGPRYRLSSAMLRDQALAVSGLLVEEPGGPAVKPYQPPGVWEEMSFGNIRYEQDHGASLYRRSLYTFWRRTTAPTMLFDTASRQVCTVRQARTNTPLQALTLLNDVTYVEAARLLAERVMTTSTQRDQRISHLFRLLTSRFPSEREQAILTARLEKLRQQYTADKEAAAKLLRQGECKASDRFAPEELAAYAGLAALLMNLDEVQSKE